MRTLLLKVAFTASIALALASCSSDDGDSSGTSSAGGTGSGVSSSSGGTGGLSSGGSGGSSSSEVAGGVFNPALTVSINNDGLVQLGGKIVAAEGNTVTKVTATADGKLVTIVPDLELPATTVDLTGTFVVGVCAATNTTTGKIFNITITAEFVSGDDLIGSMSATIDCSLSTEPDLVKREFVLSYAGNSYADLDAGITMNTAMLATKAGDVDVWAYNNTTGVGGAKKIYSPWHEASPEILYESGAYSVVFPLSAADGTMLKNATKPSDMLDFLLTLDAIISGADVDDIDIAEGNAFLVSSTEEGAFACYITEDDTLSVTFECIVLE